MKCQKCSSDAILERPRLCERHFALYFEKRVLATVRKYRLIGKNDLVAVAASGGKDSTACLYVLSRHYNVIAMAIDEGIRGYRQKTLRFLKAFCQEHGIRLEIVSAKDKFGKGLDQVVGQGSGCSLCGAMRRRLLNTAAREAGAKVIATGHNMDDEAQSVLMNILRNTMHMCARLGPKSGSKEITGFVPRVKPLYHISEKEAFAYCYIKGFKVPFAECPYTAKSFRNSVREQLNILEGKHSGTKQNIISGFLRLLPKLQRKMSTEKAPFTCARCGEPSAREVCRVCQVLRT